MNKKAVVTGGAGFVGSHIVDGLLAEGFEVHVVDNLVNGKKENVAKEAVLHELDILETAALVPIFEGAHAIFHEAALPRVQFSIEHPLEAHQANVNGTLSVLIAAHKAGARRVVFAASSSAYGNQEELHLREDMAAGPVHPYGLHKLMGEQYLKLWNAIYGLETVSLRYFNVYGPRLDPNGPYALVIGRFLEQIKNGEPVTITGDGTQTRDFTHTKDVVRANLLAMESTRVGKGEAINIGSGSRISINELAELLGAKETVYIPARTEAHDTLADIRRAKDLLDWEPRVPFNEGIEELRREFGIS